MHGPSAHSMWSSDTTQRVRAARTSRSTTSPSDSAATLYPPRSRTARTRRRVAGDVVDEEHRRHHRRRARGRLRRGTVAGIERGHAALRDREHPAGCRAGRAGADGGAVWARSTDPGRAPADRRDGGCVSRTVKPERYCSSGSAAAAHTRRRSGERRAASAHRLDRSAESCAATPGDRGCRAPLVEPQKARGVVVQDVALLLRRQEVRRLDGLYR